MFNKSNFLLSIFDGGNKGVWSFLWRNDFIVVKEMVVWEDIFENSFGPVGWELVHNVIISILNII